MELTLSSMCPTLQRMPPGAWSESFLSQQSLALISHPADPGIALPWWPMIEQDRRAQYYWEWNEEIHHCLLWLLDDQILQVCTPPEDEPRCFYQASKGGIEPPYLWNLVVHNVCENPSGCPSQHSDTWISSSMSTRDLQKGEGLASRMTQTMEVEREGFLWIAEWMSVMILSSIWRIVSLLRVATERSKGHKRASKFLMYSESPDSSSSWRQCFVIWHGFESDFVER